jgi:hypothetical protein
MIDFPLQRYIYISNDSFSAATLHYFRYRAMVRLLCEKSAARLYFG